MSFSPLFNILDTKGFNILANFPPNNWEVEPNIKTNNVVSFYTNGKKWISKNLSTIESNNFKRFSTKDFRIFNSKEFYNFSPIILLKMSNEIDNSEFDELPNIITKKTEVPEWRSTIGFEYNKTETSYQGEINPFPPKASLLTFHPFIQYKHIENFLVFLNVEKSPIIRESTLDVFNGNDMNCIDRVLVKSNMANIIPIDNYKFKKTDLPVFCIKNMAGIPFGFGINRKHSMLSLEHTHPPSSFSLHGNRFLTQKNIKELWFKSLYKNDY